MTPTLVEAEDDAVAATIFNAGFDLTQAALFAPHEEIAGPDSAATMRLPFCAKLSA